MASSPPNPVLAAMALDSRRCVAQVTGSSPRESFMRTPVDATTVAYDMAGTLLRVDRYTSRYHVNSAEDVAVDPRDGSVHIAGTVVRRSGLNSDCFALAYPTASPTG